MDMSKIPASSQIVRETLCHCDQDHLEDIFIGVYDYLLIVMLFRDELVTKFRVECF